MQNISYRKLFIHFLIIAVVSALFSYSIALRFPGFFTSPRTEKIILFSTLLSLVILINIFIAAPLVIRLMKDKPTRFLTRLLLPGFIAFIIFMAMFYRLPAFPQNVNMEIKPGAQFSELYPDKHITITSIQVADQPDATENPINLVDLNLGEGWHYSGSNLQFSQRNNEIGSIRYSGWLYGNITVFFLTGPDQGTVEIQINDQVTNLDLNNSTQGLIEISHDLSQSLIKADRPRKLMLMAGIVADFITVFIFFEVLSLSIYDLSMQLALKKGQQRFHKRFARQSIKIRGLATLSGVVVISLLMVFLSNLRHTEVNFSDPSLEAAVRELINKPSGPIYSQHLLTIIELDLSERGIEQLEGIKVFRNLRILNLENNPLQDISPLSQLEKLQILNLANTSLSDFQALYRLKKLQSLNLSENHISDISPLQSLKQLQHVDLSHNNIVDISSLSYLTELKEVNLRENVISDISAIANLKNLSYLNLHSNTAIHDLSPIANLTKLETLILRNISVGDQIGILKNLNKLHYLNLRNCSITDLTLIAELIQNGSLKDDPGSGIVASVDILENHQHVTDPDPYKKLRPYWDNISLRYSINLPYYPSPIKPPQFSHQSGFYKEGFYLTLTATSPDQRILYTTNGADPSMSSSSVHNGETIEYLKPIFIEENRNVVIRGMTFDKDGTRSNVITHTFFVKPGVASHTFPIMSITTDPDGFFNDERGIYVPGNLYQNIYPETPWINPANYTQRGLKWERPIYLQMFNSTGEVLLAQNAGVRVHGGGSTYFPQKSLRIYAKQEYDPQGQFIYDFFPSLNNRFQDGEVTTFKTLILRNGGNDWQWTFFKDALSHDILTPTKLDIQAYYPVVVYLNGEYWGLYNLRPRFDSDYFNKFYKIEGNDIALLEEVMITKIGNLGESSTLRIGDDKDLQHFENLFKMIDTDYLDNEYKVSSTLSDPEKYTEFSLSIDIENLIDYYAVQIYFNNADWPGNNEFIWRKKVSNQVLGSDVHYGHDGKYRWMIVDTDFGFMNPSNNKLASVLSDSDIEYTGVLRSTFFIRSLMQNIEFRNAYINRSADLLNTLLKENVVINKINQFEQLYYPEIDEQIARWGNLEGSVGKWLENVEEMREFALLRPEYQRQHILDYFSLPDTAEIHVQSDGDRGFVKVNTILIGKGTAGVVDTGNWTGVYFQGVPIQITALPQPGSRFSHWEGLEKEGTNPFIEIELTGDLFLKAVFTPDE